MSRVYTVGGVEKYSRTATPNSAPFIGSISPATVTEGDGNTTVTITGTGFLASTTGTIGGVSRTITYTSATQVSMAVLAADIDTAGLAEILLTNPTPGGGTSNGVNLVIEALALVAFDPATHGANLTLSNGNYSVARGAAANAFYSVRGTTGKSSGKWYWEFKYTSATTNGYIMVGAATSAQGQTGYPGDATTGRGFQSRPGTSDLQYVNGASNTLDSGNPNPTTNDIAAFALDMDGSTLKLYVNNSLVHTWSSLPAGTWYPCAALYTSGNTLNLQSTLTYSPPTGYTPLTV